MSLSFACSIKMGKKRKSYGPRRKRMQRPARLVSAKATEWADKYTGKNIVRGYSKWYGVDELCAVVELRQLGVPISTERETELRKAAAQRSVSAAGRRKRKQEKTQEDDHPDSDGTFAFIAGYTSWGFSYGVTWEELNETPPWMNDEEEESEPEPACDFKKAARHTDELPF